MSEEGEKAEGSGDEPSMEDILSSIRNILSDENPEDDSNAKKSSTDTNTSVEVLPEANAEAEDSSGENDQKENGASMSVEAGSQEDDISDNVTAEDNVLEEAPAEPLPDSEQNKTPPMPEPMEDILELTPDMVAKPDLISQSTFQSSQDLLSELAKAILDRRDMGISSGTDATLEEMVREMVKPLLREWLDRNLPYMIERLVKKEIDHMINRAERLHF